MRPQLVAYPTPGGVAPVPSAANRGEPLWLDVEGERVAVRVGCGQVQVELPFDVDFVRLAQLLREEGYFYAHHPERVDAQGWGRHVDYEGYYPYWVWREGLPGTSTCRVIFACPPEEYQLDTMPRPAFPSGRHDVELAAEPAVMPVIGPRVLAEIRRWVPFLRRAKRPAPSEPDKRSTPH